MLDSRTPVARMVNIKKSFGQTHAVRGVDLDLFEGEILALVGDNGAGKSTLVKILAGVFPPTEGEIFYQNKRVVWRDPGESRVAGIEIVYQDLGLIPLLSVARNFFLGKEPIKNRLLNLLDTNRMRTDSLRAIGELGIVLPDADAVVGTLSGGQQKAVAIARSLYYGVKVLILDEPTAALSLRQTREVLDVVHSLKRRHISVIFITHNIHHAFSVADRFVVLAAGRKLWEVQKESVTPEQLATAVLSDKIEAE